MGARSFMLATRTPMSRDGFDAWLRTPLPDLAVIDNPSAMYTGWALDGADPDWDLTGLGAGALAVKLARQTLDDAARAELYRRVDERVYRAAPWLYLWFPVDLWAQHPSIEQWELPVIFNGQRWTGVRRRP